MHLRESKYAEGKLCNAKKKILITTNLPLGMVFVVLGPLNQTSYHVNSLGALPGHKDGDRDSCTS